MSQTNWIVAAAAVAVLAVGGWYFFAGSPEPAPDAAPAAAAPAATAPAAPAADAPAAPAPEAPATGTAAPGN